MRAAIANILKELENSVLNRKEEVDFDNFKKIKAEDSGKSIAFIDGGNAELVKAPNFSVHFIRAVGIIFRHNKRIRTLKKEFFCLSYAVQNNGIMYKTKVFPLQSWSVDEKDLNFNCLDNTIMQGREKASVSFIGNIARRFAELKLGAEIEADIAVIDGNLKPVYTNEKKYIDNFKNKDKTVCGIAKTSDIITSNGNCPVAVLNSAGIDYAWQYKTKKRAYAKLNKASSYVFSIEANKDYEKAISQIALNSNDAVFPGYPYGLLLADRLARISNNEKQRMTVMFKTNKEWEKIVNFVNASNAHDILDNVS